MTGNNDYYNLRRSVNALSSNVTKMIGSKSVGDLGRNKDIKGADNFNLPYIKVEDRGEIDSARGKVLSTQASSAKNQLFSYRSQKDLLSQRSNVTLSKNSSSNILTPGNKKNDVKGWNWI